MNRLKFSVLCALTLSIFPIGYLSASEIHTEHPISNVSMEQEEYAGGDLFPGTVSIQNGRYILKRCTSGGNDYVLDFTDPKFSSGMNPLINNKTQFWVNVFGVYSEEKNEHHLKVTQPVEIHKGESCHLSDFLNDLIDE